MIDTRSVSARSASAEIARPARSRLDPPGGRSRRTLSSRDGASRSAPHDARCSTRRDASGAGPPLPPPRRSPRIARLSASVPERGEDDLVRGSREERREPLARVLESALGTASELVNARGVAEVTAEERKHRLQHLGGQRRRGVVVEIDRLGHGVSVARSFHGSLELSVAETSPSKGPSPPSAC